MFKVVKGKTPKITNPLKRLTLKKAKFPSTKSLSINQECFKTNKKLKKNLNRIFKIIRANLSDNDKTDLCNQIVNNTFCEKPSQMDKSVNTISSTNFYNCNDNYGNSNINNMNNKNNQDRDASKTNSIFKVINECEKVYSQQQNLPVLSNIAHFKNVDKRIDNVKNNQRNYKVIKNIFKVIKQE